MKDEVEGLTSNGLVTTALGDIPERDLDIKVIPQAETADAWILARECRYTGRDPMHFQHRGEIVRRDVWVTIKRGQAAAVEGGL